MDIEKFTERSRGFIQSAQGLALRSGNQQFTPEHLLKVLLEDEEGLCASLVRQGGGDVAEALRQVDLALSKLPKVQGSGAGQLYLVPTHLTLVAFYPGIGVATFWYNFSALDLVDGKRQFQSFGPALSDRGQAL